MIIGWHGLQVQHGPAWTDSRSAQSAAQAALYFTAGCHSHYSDCCSWDLGEPIVSVFQILYCYKWPGSPKLKGDIMSVPKIHIDSWPLVLLVSCQTIGPDVYMYLLRTPNSE
jgi:hypothetical protein